MTRSVIYHRQNHTEFHNNMFVFETLNVENAGNKSCNKKKTAAGNKHLSVYWIFTHRLFIQNLKITVS